MPVAMIEYSPCMRGRALRAKEYLEKHGFTVILRETRDCWCCRWEIWFPWGKAKDPTTVVEYYRVYRGSRGDRDF